MVTGFEPAVLATVHTKIVVQQTSILNGLFMASRWLYKEYAPHEFELFSSQAGYVKAVLFIRSVRETYSPK